MEFGLTMILPLPTSHLALNIHPRNHFERMTGWAQLIHWNIAARVANLLTQGVPTATTLTPCARGGFFSLNYCYS